MLVSLLQRLKPTRRFVCRLARGRADNVVSQIAPYLDPSQRIIDIGAGTCSVCELLTERGYDVTPVDVEDLSFIDGLAPRLYDGARLPFADDEFDVALLLTVLHHAHRPEQVLAEAARVARRVIVMEDVYQATTQRLLLSTLDSVLNLDFAAHPRNYRTEQGWLELFEARGLTVRGMSHERWLAFTSATYDLVRQYRQATAHFSQSRMSPNRRPAPAERA